MQNDKIIINIQIKFFIINMLSTSKNSLKMSKTEKTKVLAKKIKKYAQMLYPKTTKNLQKNKEIVNGKCECEIIDDQCKYIQRSVSRIHRTIKENTNKKRQIKKDDYFEKNKIYCNCCLGNSRLRSKSEPIIF